MEATILPEWKCGIKGIFIGLHESREREQWVIANIKSQNEN